MRALWLILVLAVAVLADPASAQHFVPHRAIYEMSLHGSGRDSSIMSVDGEMALDWGETCEGWTLEHRLTFEIGVGGEQRIRLSTHVATWEARDGLSYRFNVRNLERDGNEERIEGSARLDGKGMGGTARYTSPEAKTVTLPPGTVFPTAHSDEVLARAAEATVSFKRIVFDGLSTEGLFEASAVIGAPYPKGEPRREAEKPLAGLRSWPTHIAFYRYGSADAAPDNEVSFRMYADGVADDMIIDFGQFKVLAVLKALELTPRPSCK
jgi:hypothetical protein